MALKEPTNKTEAQLLIGLFGYWRQHIPYMGHMLRPTYNVTRKASDCQWGASQKQAFKLPKEYILTFQQLSYLKKDDQIRLDLTYCNDYGTWALWTKSSQDKLFKPPGFWTKHFPYASSKYSNLEKLIWLLFEALKATEPLTGNTPIIIRS